MPKPQQLALPLLAATAIGLLAALARQTTSQNAFPPLGPPGSPFGQLTLYLGGAGVVALMITAATALWLRQGRGPLWLQLTLTSAVGVIIALVIVLLTVQAMLISAASLPTLVLLLLVAGVISLALGMSLATTISRRVSALNHGARSLAGGDLQARVEVRGSDELAGLAAEFNQMAGQLAAGAAERERQEASRRELVAAVSHDLRTPLASLRALTDALADGLVDDPATTARYLATMQGQINHLSGLIDDLFELAQLDAGVELSERMPLSPADLVSDTLNGLRPQAEARGVSLVGSAKASPAALAAPQKLERVLYNLVANAIRHTPAGGVVTIRVAPTPAVGQPLQLCFEVDDTGEGVAPEDLPRVFERFYRGEKSRSRATGGAGLGLAIARGIVEAHGGRIWIESERGRGTTVRFTIPAA
jgi:signal transduction histidine kinase